MTEGRLDGVLVVDKPGGMTSHDVVAIVRRAVRQVTGGNAKSAKVGHAGTLDPSATGVLVLGLGRATRLLPYLQASRKTYEASVTLGTTTTTLDAEGEVLAEADASGVSELALCEVLKGFVGEVEQVPPMVSAVKVGGERLYAKARRGEVIERESRTVTIHDIVLEDFEPGPHARADFLVTCSTGTYVRTLAADVGEQLGTGAHLRSLRRLGSGRFDIGDAVDIEEVRRRGADGTLAEILMPLAQAVGDYPARRLDEGDAAALRHGRPIPASGLEGPVAAVDPQGLLLAMVEDREGAARPLAVLGA